MTCTGTAPNGFGDGTQNNLTVSILSGATVIGSQPPGAPVGINLLDNNAVNNAGTIVTTGTGIGVNNNNVILNTGTINATGIFGTGISGFANTTATNNGTIAAPADFGTGIVVFDNSTVTNNGTIRTGTNGNGIVAGGTSTLVVNTGTITIGSGIASVGIQDNVGGNTIKNSGTIIVGDGGQGISSADGTSVTNTGTIVVGAFIPGGNFTAGIATGANQTIFNSGTISVGTNSAGILALGGQNNIINSGRISVGANVGGPFQAIGIDLFGEQNVLTNNGTITAGANAFGVVLGSGANPPFGGHTVINNGTIVAGPNGFSIFSFSDFNVVTNGGTIDGMIQLNGVSNTLTNSGLITITDPGTAVGATHQIGGEFTQTPAGTLALRVNAAGVSDALFTLSAHLGGTLLAVVQPGLYGSVTTYQGVVVACNCNGLNGTKFGTVASSSVFFNATATYDYAGVSPPIFDPNVSLTLTRIPFGSVPGETQNERAVGNAFEANYSTALTGNAAIFFSNLLAVPSIGVLDQLSGEGISGTQETAFGAANMFMALMMEQGASWRSGETIDPGGITFGPATGYAAEKPLAPVFKAMPTKAPPAFEERWRAWTAGFDGTWRLDGDPGIGSANLAHRTAGGVAGLDYLLNPNLLIGVAAGGSTSSFSVPDRATNGSVDGAHLGAYGVARWESWYAAGTLAFGAFDNRTNRTIAGVGPTEMATGSFSSDLLSGRFELGYRQTFSRVAVTPFAAVQFAELWQRGFSETSTTVTGAPGVLGLTFASRTVSSLPTFLGAQVDTRVAFANGMIWSPYVRVSWVHEFSPSRDITPSFITLPGASFTVDGPRAARDAVRLETGSKLAITRNASLFGSFAGEFSDRSQMYAGKGGVKVSW